MKDIWYWIVYVQPYMYFVAKLIGGDIGKVADKAVNDFFQNLSQIILLAVIVCLISSYLGNAL